MTDKQDNYLSENEHEILSIDRGAGFDTSVLRQRIISITEGLPQQMPDRSQPLPQPQPQQWSQLVSPKLQNWWSKRVRSDFIKEIIDQHFSRFATLSIVLVVSLSVVVMLDNMQTEPTRVAEVSHKTAFQKGMQKEIQAMSESPLESRPPIESESSVIESIAEPAINEVALNDEWQDYFMYEEEMLFSSLSIEL